MQKTDDTARAAPAQLALAVLLFGSAWPAMKVGLADATPVWFAAGRAGLGALAAFTLLAALGRLRVPQRADLPIVLGIGVFQLAVFFMLANIGVRYLPAGRSAVLAYTTTLWLVPLAPLLGERLDARKALGAALGLAGVAVLVNPFAIGRLDRDLVVDHLVVGHACLLAAALSWAVAIALARRHRWHMTPLEALPWQMLVGTVLLILFSAMFEPQGHIGGAPSVVASLVWLGLFAGPLATWAATSAQRGLPTVVSSLGFLGVPVLGTAASVLFLGEEPTPSLILGGALILSGVAAASPGVWRRA